MIELAETRMPGSMEPGDRAIGRPTLPPGRLVELPGRGSTLVRELPGPANAPVVMLVHGWTVTAALNWFRLYEPLAGLARVVSFDLRGHGQGIRQPGRFRLVDAADDAIAVADQLGIDEFVVVGYSMGGTIAQLIAQRHRERVAGMVLSATWANGPSTPRHNRMLRLAHPAGHVVRRLPRNLQLRLLYAGFRMAGPNDPGERPHWFLDEVASGHVGSLMQAGAAMAAFDSRPWLADIKIPAGVAITTADSLVPPSRQHELAAHLPHAALRHIPVDHDGCVTRADVYIPPLIELIADVARRA